MVKKSRRKEGSGEMRKEDEREVGMKWNTMNKKKEIDGEDIMISKQPRARR